MIAGVIIGLLIALGIIAAVFFHLRSAKNTSESLLKNQQRGFEEVKMNHIVLILAVHCLCSIVLQDVV